MFPTILLVFAFVFFVIRTKWNPPQFELLAAGLACIVARVLFFK